MDLGTRGVTRDLDLSLSDWSEKYGFIARFAWLLITLERMYKCRHLRALYVKRSLNARQARTF